MTLPASGAISLSQVNTELGLTASTTVSLGASNVRTLAGVASGLIALSNLYGKSNGDIGEGFVTNGSILSDIFTPSNKITGFNFSTKNFFNVTALLAVTRSGTASINSTTRGYSGGGITGGLFSPFTNEIDGLIFNTRTAINPSAVLSSIKIGMDINTYNKD